MLWAYIRGHEVISVNGHDWFYADDWSPADDSRPCKLCGQMPTKDGHDPCIANLPGVKFACCGHGIEETRYAIFRRC